MDLPDLPDAFALFNPGFGEPGWELAWEPTVKALLLSQRPVLLTALSYEDAERDASFWSSVVQRSGVGAPLDEAYENNPWASLMPSGDEQAATKNRSNCMCTVYRPR